MYETPYNPAGLVYDGERAHYANQDTEGWIEHAIVFSQFS
ncbi:MAG: hypothetical protein JWP63_2950 [Candidatus Solibacter sp.]|jgi:hypothetical protein|nr:hypothetical protein [Candidatus Solibacter sp.]